VEHRAGHKVTE